MTAEIIHFKKPRVLASLAAKLPAVFVPNEKAAERFFFSSSRRTLATETETPGGPTTRLPAVLPRCEGRGLSGLADVKPPHVAAYIEGMAVAQTRGAGVI